jgi:hypothetical protein
MIIEKTNDGCNHHHSTPLVGSLLCGSGGDSKPFRIVNFVLRFVFLIKFKFKIHTLNNHYDSQCKINDSKMV